MNPPCDECSLSHEFGLHVPPALREDVEMSSMRQVPVGSNFVLEVPFKAYPKPTVRWLAQGVTVTDSTKRYRVDTVAGLTSLSIQRVQRDDEGELCVLIENEHGKLTWKCNLAVLDKPGPVERLTADVAASNTEILVSWKPPRGDGSSPLLRYELEFRNPKRRVWQLVKTGPQDDDDVLCIPPDTLEFALPSSDKETANSLASGTEYLFRVVAVNAVGKSEPVETRTPIKAPYRPKPPKLKYDVLLETSRLNAGQKHFIPVTVEGTPVPKVTWLFTPDEKAAQPSEVLPQEVQADVGTAEKDKPNKVSLNIKKATRKVQGVYTIVATNSGGEARAQFQVSVSGRFAFVEYSVFVHEVDSSVSLVI
ncbi:immunoglobulin I-set domain protein [Opisthorchis viverrini]|uniref:Immunoglobulin I-set domain protein n=1 Tax=Opisthorchis viverrini TaxID=6198 RepID=A0A1S8X9Y4_OPIVI|nr:immunoglobulin I-set domain protein [Opisthorchis viverrini]